MEANGDDVDLEFVFVSYTRMHFRVSTDEEISKYDYPDEVIREANRMIAARDRATLVKWGMDAAKRVSKRAFWLDFECVRNDDGVARSTSSSEDVYRICDIVRAAHSMIIAIGPKVSDKVTALLNGQQPPPYNREMVTPWLQQWGSRLWTLPELLLCPGEYRIRLYVIGDPSEPKALAKRNFAERAWDDAQEVKDLVDHFEGSAILAPSALIEAALTCFSRRQTDQFSQGDIAYAIMGLFPRRQRPKVNKTDSGFQAFARLAIANDCALIISRLVCLSIVPRAPWYRMDDEWRTKLREIHPFGNVRGVLGPETVVVENVFGTTIHWDNLDAEPYFNQKMDIFETALHFGPWLWTSVLPGSFIGVVIFLAKPFIYLHLSLIGLLSFLLPIAIIRSRRQPHSPLVPRLLGIEGFVRASAVEHYLWGFNHGFLEDETPQIYMDSPDTNDAMSVSSEPGQFSFTLVDTQAHKVIHLNCDMPPVAILVCGEENEMHRALLCSYDWRTQTYHRQQVLRLDHLKLDKMRLIERVRLSLACHPKARRASSDRLLGSSSTTSPVPAPTTRTGLKQRPNRVVMELFFVGMCLVSGSLLAVEQATACRKLIV